MGMFGSNRFTVDFTFVWGFSNDEASRFPMDGRVGKSWCTEVATFALIHDRATFSAVGLLGSILFTEDLGLVGAFFTFGGMVGRLNFSVDHKLGKVC